MVDTDALRAKLSILRLQESALRGRARGENDAQRRCQFEDAASEWAEIAQQITRVIRSGERSLVNAQTPRPDRDPARAPWHQSRVVRNC